MSRVKASSIAPTRGAATRLDVAAGLVPASSDADVAAGIVPASSDATTRVVATDTPFKGFAK